MSDWVKLQFETLEKRDVIDAYLDIKVLIKEYEKKMEKAGFYIKPYDSKFEK